MTEEVIESLLLPIREDSPTGSEFAYTEAFYKIKEARKSDRPENTGEYERADGFKTADWVSVRNLSEKALREQSKDLDVVIWLAEASVHLDGFRGLIGALSLLRRFLDAYWDTMYPALSEGLEGRSLTLEWLNEGLEKLVQSIPITRDRKTRADAKDEDALSLLDYLDSKVVGARTDCIASDGSPDREKINTYQRRVEEEGRTSAEKWESSVMGTSREFVDNTLAELDLVLAEHAALRSSLEEHFGDAEGPALSRGRAAIDECRSVVQSLAIRKKKEEPLEGELAVLGDDSSEDSSTNQSPFAGFFRPASGDVNGASEGSWQAAEQSILSGKVEQGLSEMTRLAASETSGRARFQRKLFLAEVYLTINRTRLARAILEELNEQIEEFKLERWENTDLVGKVWSRLYQCYSDPETGNQDQARHLYQRLCRLDPWQAYGCDE